MATSATKAVPTRQPNDEDRAFDLSRLVSPRSIAVVGASPNVSGFGARITANLASFEGALYLVNPRYEKIDGRRCYHRLADLPEVPDCVVLAVGVTAVEAMFEEAIAAGAGSVVIIASGFAETGAEADRALQARLVARSCESNVPILGPNTIGLVNFSSRAGITFLTGLDLERGYDRPAEDRVIGLVSQSGALGLSLTQAMSSGVYFSHMLACGNSAVLDVADLADHLIDDPQCKVIVCLLEGLSDPRKLERVTARATRQGKPLILCKMAQGEHGAKAAASHTGSLAGSHAAYCEMVSRAGGIIVDRFEDLIETAAFFAKSGAPSGDGAMVIATSGGAAILCADAAEAAHVALPQPTGAVKATLTEHIPSFGSTANPADVTAEVLNRMDSLKACVGQIMSAPEYATLIVPHPLAYASGYERLDAFNEIALRNNKVIAMIWMSGWLEGPGALKINESPGLALFHSAGCCMRAIAAWQEWHRRAAVPTAPAPEVDRGGAPRHQTARHAIAAAPARVITERLAKEIIAPYGIPVTQDRRAATADAAGSIADEMPGRLVMKIDSPDIAHKTEVGGIVLGLEGREKTEAAFRQMMQTVAERAPDATIDGVILQTMVPPGAELVIGGRTDDAFGPLIMVGLGGIFVELIADSVTAPAPVTPDQAAAMIGKLRGQKLLQGFRDLAPVDIARLAEIVARTSEFMAEHADQIEELDLNPLICNGAEIIATDALIIRKG